MTHESLKLEPSGRDFKPNRDPRPHMPQPPPVRLTAVEDVHVPTVSRMSDELDAFYVGLLRFEREPAEAAMVYRGENFRLRFDVQRPPVERDNFRPVLIEVPNLRDIEHLLIDREIEYERQRGLEMGGDVLVLLDPAGNWVNISEFKRVR